MARIRQTYVVTIEIDTIEAMNFPEGFSDPESGIANGFNENSYPNWDINYVGDEVAFIESNWEEFKNRYRYAGLHCNVAQVRFDF